MSLTKPVIERLKITLFSMILPGCLLILLLPFPYFFRAEAESGQTISTQPPLTEALFGRGKILYEKQCSSCHGLTGAGDGEASYLLYPKPRNFTRGEFRMISTSEIQPTDGDLFKTISRGMPGSSMPSWDHLPGEDRWALIYYVRYLTELGKQVESGKIKPEALKKDLGWEQKKDLAVSKLDPASVIHPQMPQMTQERFSRGRDLFVKGCVSCHGLQGKGDGKMMMKDSFGIPIRPRDLTAGVFKGEATPEALYLRIALGLPGSPMPSYRDAFTEEQIWDLVQYIRTLPEDGKMDKALMSRHFIKAQKIGENDLEPGSSGWDSVQGQEINLMPLWWRDDRVESVEVKTAHDGSNLYLQLSWADQTKDAQAGAVTDFFDGASVQFSKDEDPPLFAMGSVDQAVSFWHWKAAWENAVDPEEMIERRYPDYAHATPPKELFHQSFSGQDAGNPVSNMDLKQGAEEGHAKGIGSYTAIKIQAEAAEAKSLWKEQRWYVVFKRELKVKDSDRIEFSQGKTINVAFAVWDGSKQDRNGQKMVSIWNELTVE